MIDSADPMMMAHMADMEAIRYPFIARHAALNMRLVNDRRKRGNGIVQECCKKSCTVQEMANYCG
jgi:Insulin/IGF/Relaxin family